MKLNDGIWDNLNSDFYWTKLEFYKMDHDVYWFSFIVRSGNRTTNMKFEHKSIVEKFNRELCVII